MPATGVKIDGSYELDRALRQLPYALRKKVISGAVRAGGTVLKKEMQRLAPYNPRRRQGTHLRDAIMVRKVRGTTDVYKVGASYSYPKSAPHAHLVEYGTGPRMLKKPRLVRMPDGKLAKITHTGQMPAHPFIRPAVDRKGPAAIDKMGERLGVGIEREATRLAGPRAKMSKTFKRQIAR